MTLSDAMAALWNLLKSILGISIPVFEYQVTVMQMFIYFTVLGIIIKFIRGLFDKEGEN